MATASLLILLIHFLSVFSPADQKRLRTFQLIEKMSQSKAGAACRTNYTDLVTVYSDEDNAALTNMTGTNSTWIGLYRNQSSDKWSNGDDVTFSNLTGDCGSGSCCAAMKPDGSWESLNCGVNRSFMCYKKDVADLTLSYHLIFENMSWYESQRHCRKNYTDLVSIRNQNQNEAVKIEGLNSSTSFWIGLLRDDWEWTDGGRSAYRNWRTSQPRSADCVTLRKGKWEAMSCNNIQTALCYNTSIHVSEESMDWGSALDYCKKDNRNDLLRIESELDQKEMEFELRRRHVSGPLWVGLGQSRLSELLKSSSKLAPGPWSNWSGTQTQSSPSFSRAGIDTVQKTFNQKMDVSALRAVCEVKQP